MSGGHFSYYQTGQVAEEIEDLIAENDRQNGFGFGPEIIERFEEAVIVLRKAEIMVRRIDYLIGGDDGPETFLERWEKDLKCLRV